MDPLTNIQIALKNNIDVFYFSTMVPVNVLFMEDGNMGKTVSQSHGQTDKAVTRTDRQIVTGTDRQTVTRTNNN